MSPKSSVKIEGLSKLVDTHMGFDHGIAEKGVVLMRSNIEHAAGVASGGKRGQRSTGGDEFGKEVEVGLDGVTEHESVNLKESGYRVLSLEKKQTFSLCRTPEWVLFSFISHRRTTILFCPLASS